MLMFIFLNRIDVQANDLPWYLHPHNVPTLLFLPAYRFEGNLTRHKPDSITFDYNQKFTIESLIRFILFNSANFQTIEEFLNENYIKPSKHTLNKDLNLSTVSQLRFHLINIISNKLKTLEESTQEIINNIESVSSSKSNEKKSSDDQEYLGDLNVLLNKKMNNHLNRIASLKKLLELFKT